MTKWQPIETAPKRVGYMGLGEILLWNGKEILMGFYFDVGPRKYWGWRCGDWKIKPKPTHWMPLPEPPKG